MREREITAIGGRSVSHEESVDIEGIEMDLLENHEPSHLWVALQNSDIPGDFRVDRYRDEYHLEWDNGFWTIEVSGATPHETAYRFVTECYMIGQGSALEEVIEDNIPEPEEEEKTSLPVFNSVMSEYEISQHLLALSEDEIESIVDESDQLVKTEIDTDGTFLIFKFSDGGGIERNSINLELAFADLIDGVCSNGHLEEFYCHVREIALDEEIEAEESPSDVDPTEHLDSVDDEEDGPARPHLVNQVVEAPNIENEIDFETQMLRLGTGDALSEDEGTARIMDYNPQGGRVDISLRLPDNSIGRIEYDVPDDTEGPFIELVNCAIYEDEDDDPVPIQLEEIERLNDALVPVSKESYGWEIRVDQQFDFDSYIDEYLDEFARADRIDDTDDESNYISWWSGAIADLPALVKLVMGIFFLVSAIELQIWYISFPLAAAVGILFGMFMEDIMSV